MAQFLSPQYDNENGDGMVPPMKYQESLTHLLTLSGMLNSSLNLKEVLNMAMDMVVDFIKAERGFIMLYSEKGDLELMAHKNVNPEALKEYKEISTTIINAAAREGRDILSVNAQRDPRFKDSESVMLSGMRSVICVPLTVKSRIIGVVYLDNRISEGMFDLGHLKMLSAFANQAAVAIDNARLHENLIRSYDERFRLSQELHQQEKIRLACQEANRLKSEFVSIVSHELRSPLTVIKNYTSTLIRDANLGRNAVTDEMKLDFYQTIDREVDRLISLINKMLDVSRIDAGKPMKLEMKDCDVSGLIDEIIKIQKTSKFFKDNHSINTRIPTDLPEIKCDPEKLSQIISNLMENALKYSPEGGEVKISIDRDEQYYTFSIKDSGMGISEESQEKLFRKYERLQNKKHKSVPGTGLGLYLVKHLVELHGGVIAVKSKPGEGSDFIFSLPIYPPEQTGEEAEE